MYEDFYFQIPVELRPGAISPELEYTATHLSGALSLPLRSVTVNLIAGPITCDRANQLGTELREERIQKILDDLRNGPNAVNILSIGYPVLYRARYTNAPERTDLHPDTGVTDDSGVCPEGDSTGQDPVPPNA